jgi:hypothetical protein
MCIITEKSYFSEYGQFIYIENINNISIKGWNDNGKHIKTMIIPDKINGKPVVSIGSKAFMYSYLTEIEIPDSVIKIGDKAFYGSELLGKVKLSSNLTKINKELFWLCRINSIVIPDKVKIIKSGVFYSNGLNEIFIGNNVILNKSSVDYYQNGKYDQNEFILYIIKIRRKGVGILELKQT